ncbi:MAG: hypothetical protein E7457_02100 [Ruminococcaceae bacterium]|nr:hypothetical protein [Oscillospiraceae bacterium]
MGKKKVLSVQEARRRYQSGRADLLLVVIFTAVNTLLALVGSYTYFLFSSYPAYLFAMYGRQFWEITREPSALVTGGLLAVLILAVYLVCWLLSKKHRVWLTVAAVVFVVDTVLVLVDLITGGEVGYLMDLAFHVWVLVMLIRGVLCSRRAFEAAEEPVCGYTVPAGDTEFYDASMGSPNSPCLGDPQQENKYRVLVQADWNGYHIEARRSRGLTELVINGRLYGVKEGAVESFYVICARLNGHEFATRLAGTLQTIEVDGQMIAKKVRLY